MEGTTTVKPLIALVGRPNVGKSTLFNRLIQRRQALVRATPGVTRDRLYAPTRWRGRDFVLVDTGGITSGAPGDLELEVRRQAELAVEEADAVLFVVDARTGVTPEDLDVGQFLRRSGRPVIVVANKVDAQRVGIEDVYRLGLGDPSPVSAEHGRGTGDLLDRVVEVLPASPPGSEDTDDDDSPDDGGRRAHGPGDRLKITFVGRPNVGKSSLVNALVGESRMIVHDRPGTTRDAVDVPLDHDGRQFLLVDTAGMRRRSRIVHGLEGLSVLRSLRAIERSEVAVLVLDATDGPVAEDLRIAGYCQDSGRAVVIAANKWDQRKGEEGAALEFEQRVRNRLVFVSYAPLVRTSALTGFHLPRLLEAAAQAGEAFWRHIPTSVLNRVVGDAVLGSAPPAEKGKSLRIYYVTQIGSGPPTFALFVNHPDLVTPAYARYLEGRMRDALALDGTPIRIRARSRRPSNG